MAKKDEKAWSYCTAGAAAGSESRPVYPKVEKLRGKMSQRPFAENWTPRLRGSSS